MKYRIVPCVGTKIYYKVQLKRFLWWSDMPYDNFADFLGHENAIYASVKNAHEDVLKTYGTSIIYVNFELA